MIRVAMIGIAGILMALQLKALKPEYAVYLCLGVSLVIFSHVSGQLQVIAEGLQAVRECLPLNTGYLEILMKIIGITYVAEFASDLC